MLINNRHPTGQSRAGRRFTMAHALCHLLYDRGYGCRLALISGPWAPAAVERRASAFAAMLLMPLALINRHISRLGAADLASIDAIKTLAAGMQTSFIATLEHLTNLGKLDPGERDQLREWAWSRLALDS